jgi:RNA polymerase-binding transcription factor DksA
MTATKLARYERRLLQERSRVRADLRSAERELRDTARRDLSSPDVTDAGDIAAARMELEEDAAVATRESAELQEIDDALRTLYRTPRSFGICEICGKPISDSRLEILPASRLCSRHARRFERRG